MFGYIRPAPPELKIKEYELYRSVYCGLCRCMGRHTTCFSKLTLSYDFVFLALIRISLTGENISVKRCRCMAHPLKKRPYIESSESLAYCAGASALLNYHNIRDDVSDRKGFKKIFALSVLPFFSAGRRRAHKSLSELDCMISDKLSKLGAFEKSGGNSADEAADIFGELLADVFAYGLPSREERIARVIGRHTGRWIYYTDAADDYENDIKEASYNPFAAGGKPSPELLSNVMKLELIQIERAIELIDFRDSNIKSIIQNILYYGMTRHAEINVLDKKLKSEGA